MKAFCVSIRFYSQRPLDIGNPLWLGSITFHIRVVCTHWTLFWPLALFGLAVTLVIQSWYLNVAVDRVSLIRIVTKSTHTLQPEDGGRSSFKNFLSLVVSLSLSLSLSLTHTHTHTHTRTRTDVRTFIENTPVNLKVPDAVILLVYRLLN